MRKILCCGCRDWDSWDLIRNKMKDLSKDTIIIEGDARGADKMCGWIAEQLGLTVLKFPADWDKYGKAAGPIRNQQMIDKGKPTEAIAFWDGVSRGTSDMINRLKKANIPVDIVIKKKE